MEQCHFKKILLVKNRGLGDAVMGLSSLQYLNSLLPAAQIDYAIPAWTIPLFSGDQLVANLLPLDLKSFSGVLKFLSHLRKEKYDAVIELHQGGATAKILNLSKSLLGFKYYFHSHHEKGETYIKDQGEPKANIQRDLDGVWSIFKEFYGLKDPCPDYLSFGPKLWSSKSKGEPFILFGVVATREPKMWALENYKMVAEHFSQSKPGFKIYIPLAGSGDELLKKQIEELNFPANVQIVQKGLQEICSFFSNASLYLGNDTGLKHICAALGVRTFTFFGPENPREWHPYDTKTHPYFFNPGSSISPDKSFCLSTEKVIEKVESLIS